MRHNSNDGRKSVSVISHFPVSSSVSYTHLHEPEEAKHRD